MSGAENRRQSNVSSSGSSGGNPVRRGYSRTSSADSIFEDASIKANHLFARLDEERKGYLDVSMLAKACESRLNESQLSELIKQMDHDGDGRVNVDDFRRCLKSIARRNSVIRASLRATTTAARPPVTAQNSNSSTSSDSNRSRLNSDDATSSEVEERGTLSKAIRRTSGVFKPIRSRERNKDRLISRLTSNVSQCRHSSGGLRQLSTSVPELNSVDDCLGALQCQEHIYELYHLLLSENPSLSRMYESVLGDIVDFIQKSKLAQARIEQQIESERSQHKADMLRLSEELDQQVQMAEETARIRERELALAEFQSQLEARSEKIKQLVERLKQLEERKAFWIIRIASTFLADPEVEKSVLHGGHPDIAGRFGNVYMALPLRQQNNLATDVVQSQELIDSRLENLQNEVRQLRFEKTRLEDILTSTRSQLYQTRTELATMRQTFNEKSRELDNHIATFVEVVKENANLKRQLCLLQEVNRELCDANDGLCAVLESSGEEVTNCSNLREANTACALIFSNFRQLLTEYQSPLPMEHAHHLISEEMIESAAKVRRSNSVPCPESRLQNQVNISEQPVLMKSPPPFVRSKRRVPVSLTSKQQQPKSLDCSSLLPETGLESLHEDSGLSSLRDAPEFESEMEVDSPVGLIHCSKVVKLARTDEKHAEHVDVANSAIVGINLTPAEDTVSSFSANSSLVRTSSTPRVARRRLAVPTTLNTKSPSSVTVGTSTPEYPMSFTGTMDEKMRIFRVMLAGDSDVGKTSFLIRLCDNVFTGTSVSTIGIDMKMRSMEVDGRSAMLQLWDTAGQEREKQNVLEMLKQPDAAQSSVAKSLGISQNSVYSVVSHRIVKFLNAGASEERCHLKANEKFKAVNEATFACFTAVSEKHGEFPMEESIVRKNAIQLA
ncbi:unnamed protein product [Echinostoma caproni]|uniref:EF-hand domain-containing protein n=1 Tax=Echinostoma caproni TaxID=27848 RepID=A0A183A5D6_9TREM|nr:unnamed protein product [Echinostoma caproni]